MQKKKRTSKVKSTEEKTNEETKLPLLNDILTSDSNVNLLILKQLKIEKNLLKIIYQIQTINFFL